MLEQLKKSGFQGSVWPVHPSKGSLGEHTCYQSLDQLPAPPDAAFIGVNRHLTVEIVKHRRLQMLAALDFERIDNSHFQDKVEAAQIEEDPEEVLLRFSCALDEIRAIQIWLG